MLTLSKEQENNSSLFLPLAFSCKLLCELSDLAQRPSWSFLTIEVIRSWGEWFQREPPACQKLSSFFLPWAQILIAQHAPPFSTDLIFPLWAQPFWNAHLIWIFSDFWIHPSTKILFLVPFSSHHSWQGTADSVPEPAQATEHLLQGKVWVLKLTGKVG